MDRAQRPLTIEIRITNQASSRQRKVRRRKAKEETNHAFRRGHDREQAALLKKR